MALDENIVVNCTGLGAKPLFNDGELMPLKGQLIVLIPQDEVTYSTNGGVRESPAGVFVHMMPRRDGIVLGGTSERDVWTTEINDAERTRVVDGHKALFEAMKRRGVQAKTRQGVQAWKTCPRRSVRVGAGAGGAV